jgi:hypothetical protein
MDVLETARHLHLLYHNPNILEFASPTTANASLNSNNQHRLKLCFI